MQKNTNHPYNPIHFLLASAYLFLAIEILFNNAFLPLSILKIDHQLNEPTHVVVVDQKPASSSYAPAIFSLTDHIGVNAPNEATVQVSGFLLLAVFTLSNIITTTRTRKECAVLVRPLSFTPDKDVIPHFSPFLTHGRRAPPLV